MKWVFFFSPPLAGSSAFFFFPLFPFFFSGENCYRNFNALLVMARRFFFFFFFLPMLFALGSGDAGLRFFFPAFPHMGMMLEELVYKRDSTFFFPLFFFSPSACFQPVCGLFLFLFLYADGSNDGMVKKCKPPPFFFPTLGGRPVSISDLLFFTPLLGNRLWLTKAIFVRPLFFFFFFSLLRRSQL